MAWGQAKKPHEGAIVLQVDPTRKFLAETVDRRPTPRLVAVKWGLPGHLVGA